GALADDVALVLLRADGEAVALLVERGGAPGEREREHGDEGGEDARADRHGVPRWSLIRASRSLELRDVAFVFDAQLVLGVLVGSGRGDLRHQRVREL